MKKYHLLLLLLAGFQTELIACEGLRAEQAWIRALPPGPNVTAGYMTLINRSNRPIEIKGFDSPAFAAIELHEVRQQQGSMQMRKLPQLVLMPNSRAELSPGQLHLMLFEPVSEWAATGSINLNINCGLSSLEVRAEVRAVSDTDQSAAHANHPGRH